MRLADLLDELMIKRIIGSTDFDITGFQMDSRRIERGNIFAVLTEPELDDRTKYIGAALEAGAVAILVQEPIDGIDATQVVVPNVQAASAKLASRYYGDPGGSLALIGITGTKGKTTTSHLAAGLLNGCGIPTGIIGTAGTKFGEIELPYTNSTPHAIELQRLFSEMAAKGIRAVSMEASSHGLQLGRLSCCEFAVAVFTNIGHDHLNFHRTVEDYVRAKSMLFSKVIDGAAVINIDDPWAPSMIDQASCELLTYGLSEQAMLRAVEMEGERDGMTFRIESPFGRCRVFTKLSGRFNVYNCLAALGAALCSGVDLKSAIAVLPELGSVEGRLEEVPTGGKGFRVFVDFAHTEESMESILSTLKALGPKRLITVFGCGGDRDRTKRPKMGDIATRYSDFTIITSDNPRTEEPDSIIAEIEEGVVPGSCYTLEADRRKAISLAINSAELGDIVAILGKGNESYQIIGHQKFGFDDRVVTREALLGRI